MKQVKDWWLPDSDKYFGNILETQGLFQIDRLYQALTLVNPGSGLNLAVDVGAHVGMWSVELADLFPIVYSFEPASDTYDCLLANIQKAPPGRIKPFRMAIGDKDKTWALVQDDPTRPGNTGSRYVRESIMKPNAVPFRTLDSFEFPALEFLKLDAEGAEPLILQGAARTIKKYKPVVYVEAKTGFGRRFGVEDGAALTILREWGAKEVFRFKSDYVFSFS